MIEKPIRIGLRAKMLCECGKVSKARQEAESDTIHLSCGHDRTPYLLPSREGAVSLEDIINNTPDANRLWRYERSE